MVNTANLKKFYVVVNEMLAELGANGEISAQDGLVDNVMAILEEIDGGIYIESKPLNEMFDKMNKKYYDLGYEDAQQDSKQPKLFS